MYSYDNNSARVFRDAETTRGAVFRTSRDGNFITMNSVGCSVSENEEAYIMTTMTVVYGLFCQVNRAFTDGLPNPNENGLPIHRLLDLSYHH